MRKEDLAREVFGRRASYYTTSAAHTDSQVLRRVVELAVPAAGGLILDVATGTGHTALALAPHAAQVVGVDLTPEMLGEARQLQRQRGLGNVSWALADAHRLPFANDLFGALTCRRAPHHFSDIRQTLAEMARVLAPGGRLVVDDRSVPEDEAADACMNALDLWHDPSHVRNYRPSAWESLLDEAGLRVERLEPYIRHRPLSALTAGASPEGVAAIERAVAGMPESLRAAFSLVEIDGEPHLNHWYVLAAARK